MQTLHINIVKVGEEFGFADILGRILVNIALSMFYVLTFFSLLAVTSEKDTVLPAGFGFSADLVGIF